MSLSALYWLSTDRLILAKSGTLPHHGPLSLLMNLVPTHSLRPCRHIVNWAYEKKDTVKFNQNTPIALRFSRGFESSAAKMSTKIQSVHKILNTDLVPLNLCKIFQFYTNQLPDIGCILTYMYSWPLHIHSYATLLTLHIYPGTTSPRCFVVPAGKL